MAANVRIFVKFGEGNYYEKVNDTATKTLTISGNKTINSESGFIEVKSVNASIHCIVPEEKTGVERGTGASYCSKTILTRNNDVYSVHLWDACSKKVVFGSVNIVFCETTATGNTITVSLINLKRKLTNVVVSSCAFFGSATNTNFAVEEVMLDFEKEEVEYDDDAKKDGATATSTWASPYYTE